MRRRAWQLIALLLIGALLALAFIPSIQLPWIRFVPTPPQVTPIRLEIGGVALGTLSVIFRWRPTRFFVTLLHELGHSLAAAITGGHPIRITMARDSSGVAPFHFAGGSRLSLSMIYYSGYLAPGVASIGGAAAIRSDNSLAWILLTVTFLLVILLGLARSFTVIVVTVVVISATAAVLWWWPWATPAMAALLATTWGLGGIRCAREQFGSIGVPLGVADGQVHVTDSENVQRLLHVPARLVATSQLVAAILLAGFAGFLLVPPS